MRTPIKNKKQWHALRQKHIGASEVSALLGIHPRLTHYILWLSRTRGMEIEGDCERASIGIHLESGIARAFAERAGLHVGKCNYYYSDDQCEGMGASPDYFIYSRKGSYQPVALLQIKNVASDQAHLFADSPPLYYQLQVQQELACSGMQRGVLVACIGGGEIREWSYERHEPTIAILRNKIRSFWRGVSELREPDLTAADYEAVRLLYSKALPKRSNLSDNHEAVRIAGEICELQREARAIQAKIAERKAILLRDYIRDAEGAVLGGITVRSGTIKRKAYSVAESEYRRLEINDGNDTAESGNAGACD